jgi:hypothetical protein
MKQIEDDRRAVNREKARWLIARTIEVLIGTIERQSKQAAVMPFKGLLGAFIVPDGSRAAAFGTKCKSSYRWRMGFNFLPAGISLTYAGRALCAFHIDKRAARRF